MNDVMIQVTPRERVLITISIMLATIMQVLDTTIANVVLPDMQGSLGAAQDTVTWVLTSYIVAAAIATPLTAWLADRFGRKEVYLCAIVGFTGASVLCGISTSLSEMVFFRVLQGIAGAALVPLAQTIMLDINPREKHGQAMAMWGAAIMIGPIMGPTLGGWLSDSFNWRWVFFVNVPVGILAFIGFMAFLPRLPAKYKRFDFAGFALLGLAVGALQIMLDRGQQLNWFQSAEIILELGLVIGCFWMFTIHVMFKRDPFVDPSVFRDRNFVAGLFFIFITGVLLLASLVLIPPMLQQLMGYSALTTGEVMAPRGAGTMLVMLLIGRIVGRVDPRYMVFLGLALLAWSLHEMTKFSLEMDSWPVIYTGVIQGMGIGLMFTSLTTFAFSTLAPQLRSIGTSLFSLVRNIGTSVGISLVSAMLARNMQVSHADLVPHISPFTMAIDGGWADLATNLGPSTALALVNAEIDRQATMIAILNDFKMMMYLTLAAMPLLLLIRPRKLKAGEEEIHALAE